MKTTNQWRKKSKIIEDGKISHAHGLAELRLWKWFTTKSNLPGQCNPRQNFNDIQHRDWKNQP
jgi:hypothetical protein